ncbi:putative membrane protein YadS [Allocatelliglobosispora scoriae]|uniref:Putative membrane protein YadS n=1 Tax=Allocatelliglobosispora scoriae TaxID=643052 RepID=A0A841BZL4_9ACTN|nr:putative sulfate exporter family transporter [Allocatelliglobosispora scoriae]MBB5872938.1 putative membrane protein YadS [Allocatelliglobosispora scoriae]
MTAEITTADDTDLPDEAPVARAPWPWTALGLVVVLGLAWGTRWLDHHIPIETKQTSYGKYLAAIEYPVYAIALGLLGNLILTLTRLRDRLSGAFRTEFFIKTGLVLLGASINISLIWSAAGPAILQAVLLISTIFLFTWWLGGVFGLDPKLRALLSAAVSICGVSAAIAAAGAVKAKREQLAYTASLVIVFALPAIFILPWLADVFGLGDVVAGAWIGGNIDTTAAVTAAGTLAGETSLKIATIVKTTQNALLGIVAVALTAYFAFKVEKSADTPRPGLRALWDRFPKFVLGFIAASAIGTWYLNAATNAAEAKAAIGVVNDLRIWFLVLAFISIGLEFRAAPLREAGWRPIAVFASATVANLAVGLALASIIFADFTP